MPTTFTKISTASASGSQSTITFSAIPDTYTDLILFVNGRSAASNSVDALYLRFNSASTNYGNNIVVYSEATGYGCFKPSISYTHAGYLTGGSQSAGYVGNVEIYIGSYSSTTRQKPVITSGIAVSPSTSYQGNVGVIEYGLWNNTNAITQIDVTMESAAAFASGTTFALYGIKQA